jgi:hypothetical protein
MTFSEPIILMLHAFANLVRSNITDEDLVYSIKKPAMQAELKFYYNKASGLQKTEVFQP